MEHEIYCLLQRLGPEIRRKADAGHKLSVDLVAWYDVLLKHQTDDLATEVVHSLMLAWCDKFPGINLRNYKQYIMRQAVLCTIQIPPRRELYEDVPHSLGRV